jgi:hypothetical protein
MELPLQRFTIRGLLIAIAVIAGVLAIPDPWRVIALALSIPCLSLLYGRWLHAHGLIGMAGFCFWTSAIFINVLYVVASICPELHLLLLCMAWFVLVLPTLAGFGIAWSRLTSARDGDRRQSSSRAWLSVFALTLLPLVTAGTAWPFQLRFLMAKPALERLADGVAAGQAMTNPQWAGPFRIAGSAVDPASGNVCLMIDTKPNGPSGFVRNRETRSGLYGCFRPIRGDWYHLTLVGGWCYHEED